MKNKINNLRILCVIIVFSSILASCSKKWLDQKVNKSQAIPSTLKDFQAMLDDVVQLNYASTPSLAEVAADGHFYTEPAFASLKASTTNRRYANAYTWTNDIPYENLSVDWNSPYFSILSLNIVLDGLDKLESNMYDPDYKYIKAQALFHRARIFFDLAQTFAPPYNKSTSDVDLSIPARLSSDINIPSVRSTVEESYQQIIKDLKEAANSLSLSSAYLTRPSKPAAFALLARVYLSMQAYDSALVYSDNCLKIKNTLLDYNTLPADNLFIGINKEILYLNFIPAASALTTNYLIDVNLYNLYAENDLRKKIFFKTVNGNYQFKGTYGGNSAELFAGLAIDEVYLIRAECYARNNEVQLAMKDLNELLRNRMDNSIPYVDIVADDAHEALTMILLERRKELILRNTRWTDLRRLNQDSAFAITISRTIDGKTYELDPSSFRYTFPFPKEIIAQTGMPQNDGWIIP